ncbi:hypothetical protein CL654_01685 [bacterium]|nr:hypothetical protein [bacterium]|tara:strand:- start:15797 stop:16084 length:288 start_codon:yes stop_codon:yes gene_type:complete
MIKLVKTAHAQLQNPIAADNLLGLLQRLVDVLIQYGVVIAVFFIIYSGFLFVTARGSEDKIKSAKKTFLYTIIGASVLLGAWVIVTVIAETIETL